MDALVINCAPGAREKDVVGTQEATATFLGISILEWLLVWPHDFPTKEVNFRAPILVIVSPRVIVGLRPAAKAA